MSKKKLVRIPKPVDYLYERLVALLGEAPSSEIYGAFVKDIGNVPFEDEKSDEQVNFESENSRDVYHRFPELGVDLWIRDGLVYSIYMRMYTFVRGSSFARPYAGNLPAGIKLTDDCKAVQEKLGQKPIKADIISRRREGPQEYREIYELPSCRMSFFYDGPASSIVFIAVHNRESTPS